METLLQTTLKTSLEPLEAINKVAYKGQPQHLKNYVPGYERLFNQIPIPNEENLDEVKNVMKVIVKKVKDAQFVRTPLPEELVFQRWILAIEDPEEVNGKWVAGREIIVSKWRDGFATPIHGHKAGFMQEEMIYGKLVEDQYRVADAFGYTVRPIERVIFTDGTLISALKTGGTKRYHLAHALRSIGQSVSIHFIGEHSSDGRDNRLTPEYFEEWLPLKSADVERINLEQAIKSPVGEVSLVRSKNVPDYGDHYVVTTGPVVQKPHGLRPEDRVIPAPSTAILLDSFEYDSDGLIILRLSKPTTEEFYRFHDITMGTVDQVIFPNW